MRFYQNNKTEEIRINENYTSLILANYPNGLKDDSEPLSRKKVISTETFVNKIISEANTLDGMLPPNCRFLKTYENGILVVIEEPPSVRTISVDMSFSNILRHLDETGQLNQYGYNYDELMKIKRPYTFTLAIPFTIFIITINPHYEVTSGQVYFRTKQISGLGDYLLIAPFPNISDTGHVCFGERIYNKNQSIYSAIINTQNIWWTSIFNGDYVFNLELYEKTPGVCDYFTWQYFSKENPLFIYNAKWKKHSDSLGERLRKTARGQNLVQRTQSPYKFFGRVFNVPIPTGKAIKPYKRARKKIALYYDMAQGIYLKDGLAASVGDPFPYKNGDIVYIENFIGFSNSTEPSLIRIRKDKKLFTMKLTMLVKDFLSEQISKYRNQSKIKINNKIVKKGEILIFKTPSGDKVFKKVGNLRNAMDGKFEISLGGGEYYLADRFPTFKKFDKNKVEICGKTLKIGDRFVLLKNIGDYIPIFQGCKVQYKTADIIRREKLSFVFDDVEGKTIGTIKLPSDHIVRSRLVEESEVEPAEPVFRLGRTLVCNNNPHPKTVIWKTRWGYIKGGAPFSNVDLNLIVENLLKDDELFIPSYNLDLSFKIGDKVVVSDWHNPLNMLNIKTIRGFNVNTEQNTLSIVLQDKKGNFSQCNYIIISEHIEHMALVNIGKIRKVKNEHNGIKVGTKIKATKSGIPCFPKKDTNIIVAFITDTGIDEPLVLCSNCCTLWFNDMIENFEKYTMRNPKWNELKHANIDISKIKAQPGDIVQLSRDFYNKYGYCLYLAPYDGETVQIRALNLKYYTEHYDYLVLDRSLRIPGRFRFDSILTPRFDQSRLGSMRFKPAFPNFHGGFDIIPEKFTKTYFPLKAGRFIDVSNLY